MTRVSICGMDDIVAQDASSWCLQSPTKKILATDYGGNGCFSMQSDRDVPSSSLCVLKELCDKFAGPEVVRRRQNTRVVEIGI